MRGWGQIMNKKIQKGPNCNFYFWSASHPHPILGTILHHLGELAGAPVTGFHFLVQQRMSQWSFAWIPRLAPYQFLLIKESKNVGQ